MDWANKRFGTGSALFSITVSMLIGATIGYILGVSLPLFLKQMNTIPKPISTGFLINYIVIIIEVLCAMVGMFIFLRFGRKNPLLLLSILIASLEFKVYNFKFTFLLLELAFNYQIGAIGLGINCIGILLIIWYLYL
jgi:hypothetical protein